jgi:hypothetical protein
VDVQRNRELEPTVLVRLVSSDRERPAVVRIGPLTPYMASLIGEELCATRPGVWVELTVPNDVDTCEVDRLLRTLAPHCRGRAEVLVRRTG